MTKGIHTGANLLRLMPNVKGPREKKRRLHPRRLYAAPIWAHALEKKYTGDMLTKAQRYVSLRIISDYRTVSTSAALVVASLPPIDLLRSVLEVYESTKERERMIT